MVFFANLYLQICCQSNAREAERIPSVAEQNV